MKVRYLVLDEPDNYANGDVFSTVCKTLEAANREAEYQWEHLTKSEQKKRWIHVAIVTEEDLNPDAYDEDGEICWDSLHSYDSTNECFDSHNL